MALQGEILGKTVNITVKYYDQTACNENVSELRSVIFLVNTSHGNGGEGDSSANAKVH